MGRQGPQGGRAGPASAAVSQRSAIFKLHLRTGCRTAPVAAPGPCRGRGARPRPRSAAQGSPCFWRGRAVGGRLLAAVRCTVGSRGARWRGLQRRSKCDCASTGRSPEGQRRRQRASLGSLTRRAGNACADRVGGRASPAAAAFPHPAHPPTHQCCCPPAWQGCRAREVLHPSAQASCPHVSGSPRPTLCCCREKEEGQGFQHGL